MKNANGKNARKSAQFHPASLSIHSTSPFLSAQISRRNVLSSAPFFPSGACRLQFVHFLWVFLTIHWTSPFYFHVISASG